MDSRELRRGGLQRRGGRERRRSRPVARRARRNRRKRTRRRQWRRAGGRRRLASMAAPVGRDRRDFRLRSRGSRTPKSVSRSRPRLRARFDNESPRAAAYRFIGTLNEGNGMNENKRTASRRQFLKQASAVAAAGMAPYFVPATAFGALAPSNRFTLACIGVGNQGSLILDKFLKLKTCQVVAV